MIANTHEQPMIRYSFHDGPDLAFGDLVGVDQDEIESMCIDIREKFREILNMGGDAYIGRVVRTDQPGCCLALCVQDQARVHGHAVLDPVHIGNDLGAGG